MDLFGWFNKNNINKKTKRTVEYKNTAKLNSTTTPTGDKSKKWFSKKTISASRSSPSLSTLGNDDRRLRKKTLVALSGRRGQTTKPEQQVPSTPEDLSRASSVSNLNAVGDAKKKKSASKDNLTAGPVAPTPPSTTTTVIGGATIDSGALIIRYETEIETLQHQLYEMSNEKTNLLTELNERKGQLNGLQNEIIKLKMTQEQNERQLEQLNDENAVLRSRLRDVAHSPLSDAEKQQLLYETPSAGHHINHHHHLQAYQQQSTNTQRHHSSAPASIATNLLETDNGGDVTTCPTPEWDLNSSGNVSEISVACLQDKINQMQETHYSTNEELQATLQELTDLQKQLSDLQQENERLLEEKNLMFESLCRQTERLNDARDEIESLKQLLYHKETNEADGKGDGEKNKQNDEQEFMEREKKLVELLKVTQEEREGLLRMQERLGNDLDESRTAHAHCNDDMELLNERLRTLENTLDTKNAEHRQLDRELAQARDTSNGRQIEISRLKDLLENARTKINELEQDRALSDKSELDELLDSARKEKDALESELADLKEQLALSKNEIDKLKEQLSIVQEECKVIRNNAKTTQSDLEYRCDKLTNEKCLINEQLQQFQDALNDYQLQIQCNSEEKRQLSAVLAETQRNLTEVERRNEQLLNELNELKRLRNEENEEWEKFQNDLLTSVRVANDFKTEAQQDLQKMIMENKAHRERVRQLEAQIDKLKVTTTGNPVDTPTLLHQTTFPNDEFTFRRQKAALSRQNSRQSVKSLIESIENAGKPIKNHTSLSRTSSNSSINSIASSTDLKTPTSPVNNTPYITTSIGDLKQPIKEQNKLGKMLADGLSNKNDKMKTDDTFLIQKSRDFTRRNSYSDLSERKDPLNSLVKNGGSKRNALLKWCQNKTVGYRNIDITNFSSSWNDGLALCALLHTYLPDRIPYDSLTAQEKRRNFALAFSAAESVGILTTLNINDMIQLERPDWQQVMAYVTAIYRHFET